METITIIIWLAISVVCTFIHKNKGYSPIAGFLWGACFSVLGLIIVLLEKDKSENDRNVANKKDLSVLQWLLIFLGIGGIAFGLLMMCL